MFALELAECADKFAVADFLTTNKVRRKCCEERRAVNRLQRGGGRLGSATLKACALSISRLLANGFLRERIKMPR